MNAPCENLGCPLKTSPQSIVANESASPQQINKFGPFLDEVCGQRQQRHSPQADGFARTFFDWGNGPTNSPHLRNVEMRILDNAKTIAKRIFDRRNLDPLSDIRDWLQLSGPER